MDKHEQVVSVEGKSHVRDVKTRPIGDNGDEISVFYPIVSFARKYLLGDIGKLLPVDGFFIPADFLLHGFVVLEVLVQVGMSCHVVHIDNAIGLHEVGSDVLDDAVLDVVVNPFREIVVARCVIGNLSVFVAQCSDFVGKVSFNDFAGCMVGRGDGFCRYIVKEGGTVYFVAVND